MTEKFFELNEFDIDLRIHDEGRQDPRPLLVPDEITSAGPVMQDGNVNVTCALVDHPPIKVALAYRFDTANRSVVSSGDTRTTDSLIALAKGADVLVCEGQYLPGIQGSSRDLDHLRQAARSRVHPKRTRSSDARGCVPTDRGRDGSHLG